MSERSKNWSHACLNKRLKAIGVHLIHVAHKTKVDTILKRTLVRADDIHVGTGESDGINAKRLQLRNNILVDQSTIDHGHHLKHLCIGYASTPYHLALYAKRGSNLSGSSSTTMNQYLSSIYLLETFKKSCELCRVLNHGTAYFYYCDFHKSIKIIVW